MQHDTSLPAVQSNQQVFDFNGARVRVITEDPDNPQWVATDVAKVLGYRNSPDMVRRLDEDEKGTRSVRTLGGTQTVTTVTESGLYTAILGSKRSEAKAFKRWVTHEVLPTIRKHGGYLTPRKMEEVLTDPDTIIQLATQLKTERQRAAALEARNQQIEPAARSWDTLAKAGGDFSVSEAAKTLSRDPNITIGRDRLFQKLNALGWIYRTKGHRPHWEAYQTHIDNGRLLHKLSRPFLNERTGEWEQPAPTIRITPKGMGKLHALLTKPVSEVA